MEMWQGLQEGLGSWVAGESDDGGPLEVGGLGVMDVERRRGTRPGLLDEACDDFHGCKELQESIHYIVSLILS
jgi:hypothetical protein